MDQGRERGGGRGGWSTDRGRGSRGGGRGEYRGGTGGGGRGGGSGRGGGGGEYRGDGGGRGRGARDQYRSDSGSERGGGGGGGHSEYRGDGRGRGRGGRDEYRSDSGSERGGGGGGRRGEYHGDGGGHGRGSRDQYRSDSGSERGGGGRGRGEYRGDGGGRGRGGSDRYRGDSGRGRGDGYRGEGGEYRGGGGGRRGGYGGGPPARSLATIPNKPTDPPNGKKGRQTIVETNYLPVKISSDLLQSVCYHYDVTIRPEKLKRSLSKAMEEFRRRYYPDFHPVFDGVKNLYSRRKLPESSGEVSINIDGIADSKPVVFTISIKQVREVDLSILQNYRDCTELKKIQDACQLLGIVLRALPGLRLINVGRNFYSPPPEMIPLGCGTELFRGFYQALSLASRGPMINFDVIHKAFVMGGPLLDLIKNMFFMREIPNTLEEYHKKGIMEMILDKKVEYKVQKHVVCYSVNGFKGSAKSEIIPETKMTVQQYFKREKQYEIKYPNLPLLWVGSKQRENPILIPMELCSLRRGQSARRSVQENSEIIREMIKLTATPPGDRKQRILEQIQNAGYRDNPFLEEFGISIGEDFQLVNARVLDPPSLKYKSSEARPNRGAWDIRSKQFLNPSPLKKWIVLCLDKFVTAQKVNDLQSEIIKSGTSLGMVIEKPEMYKVLINQNTIQRDVKTFLEEKKGYDLIIVILSNKTNFYGMVKQEAELNIGCLTQCLLSKTISRDPIPPSVVTNILLKVNAKLNGTNHILVQRPQFLKGNVMVMGADVTHPPASNRNVPSYAAVTASHDLDFFQYNTACQLQTPAMETIVGLENILNRHLMYFKKNNAGKKLDHIIFFRDGVSEGQFEDIKKMEVNALKQCCAKVFGKSTPKITFIVVQKRHHTRFFSLEYPGDNVDPGTCVDTGITHPTSLNLKDFYLASHQAIKGTARPTKYCTIYDDAKLTYDDIEELAYYLCHMYSRCTRAVSYPAPTYYAHLAADKAKKLYENKYINMDDLMKKKSIDVVNLLRDVNPMSFV